MGINGSTSLCSRLENTGGKRPQGGMEVAQNHLKHPTVSVGSWLSPGGPGGQGPGRGGGTGQSGRGVPLKKMHAVQSKLPGDRESW